MFLVGFLRDLSRWISSSWVKILLDCWKMMASVRGVDVLDELRRFTAVEDFFYGLEVEVEDVMVLGVDFCCVPSHILVVVEQLWKSRKVAMEHLFIFIVEHVLGLCRSQSILIFPLQLPKKIKGKMKSARASHVLLSCVLFIFNFFSCLCRSFRQWSISYGFFIRCFYRPYSISIIPLKLVKKQKRRKKDCMCKICFTFVFYLFRYSFLTLAK